jgi:hypothetical protein
MTIEDAFNWVKDSKLLCKDFEQYKSKYESTGVCAHHFYVFPKTFNDATKIHCCNLNGKRSLCNFQS